MFSGILELFISSLDFLVYLIPIAVPIALVYFFLDVYRTRNRKKYFNSLDKILLEVIPPQDHQKTPLAMEILLQGFYQTGGESTWIDTWVQGSVRPWFTLEMASLEGHIHFYIHTESKYKKFIEAQVYAQYPGSEVREVEDYAAKFNMEEYDMEGVEYELVKPDPYPIATYVDYQLDKEADEETKADPFTPVIEFFNQVEKDNYMFLQILIRAHKAEDPDPNRLFPSFFKKIDNWKEQAKSEIKKIKADSFVEFDEGDRKRKQNAQTEGQKRQISALERSLTKHPFDAGVRMLVLGKKGSFEKGMFGLMLGIFRQFGSFDLNGLKPERITKFKYPWSDIFGTKKKKLKQEYLDAYQLRHYFWKPDWKGDDRKVIILNTEELATIYHFPGKVSQAPSLGRVDSRKAAAPDNLPT